MVTFTKKSKILIAAAAVVALMVVVAPYAAYALPASDENALAESRTLVAKGIARIVNGENVTFPANFTLVLERSESTDVPRFNVTGGTVFVNEVPYSIASGNGGVLRGRHLILLQAQGTGPDGQPVTLKLAGRYFWLGGHLYVARIGARLSTVNENFTLLLRAEIRV
ncbi:MAG: hypothetical protein ACE14S_00355 [Candidatus Bathyarchaeia archaeon]